MDGWAEVGSTRPVRGGPHGPTVSIVIPAHDEARVVGRLLQALAALTADGRAEVVVVANGCSDDTAEVARGFAGVTVIELAEASKVAALNAGDEAAVSFPRIYLDADVELEAATVLALADALPDEPARIAAPTVRFETEGRPWAVRAFYRIYTRLPYASDGLVGLGVYAVSRSGRARFGAFPALTADDLYVQQRFAPAERAVLGEHSFTVHAPRSLVALVRVRTRTAAGNRELADGGSRSSTRATMKALLRVVAGAPGLLPAALVYVGVTLAARRRARQTGRRWERDDTTR